MYKSKVSFPPMTETPEEKHTHNLQMTQAIIDYLPSEPCEIPNETIYYHSCLSDEGLSKIYNFQ